MLPKSFLNLVSQHFDSYLKLNRNPDESQTRPMPATSELTNVESKKYGQMAPSQYQGSRTEISIKRAILFALFNTDF